MKRAPKIDRSLVMRRAWADFRFWHRHGDPRSFGDCLKGAWAAARLARDTGSEKFRRAA